MNVVHAKITEIENLLLKAKKFYSYRMYHKLVQKEYVNIKWIILCIAD